MNWIPTAFNPDENEIILRSIRCIEKVTKNTDFDFKACPECRWIEYSSDFKDFLSRAIEATKHTPWDYLTFVQVKDLLSVTTKEIHKLRMKVENYENQKKITARHMNDYARIMKLIADNEIVGLRRLIAAALRHGSSPEVIVETIYKAIEGLYFPHGGFSRRELDMAFLAKALGGPRLLYALQKFFGLPSRNTISRQNKARRYT